MRTSRYRCSEESPRPRQLNIHPLTRRYEGTGLGLPITKRLVELHNGTVNVQNRPGAGATFSSPIRSTIRAIWVRAPGLVSLSWAATAAAASGFSSV
ncbi:MAG: hypothetical protein KA314_27145 [Chloroflexi bacterium]|nr:hypothetical protein [Chloroflexota bacterium]MBP8059530.1 hypothetical protein [Chloroflexota bacterium]